MKNLGDAGVKIEIEGDENETEEFIERIRKENPPLSQIDSIEKDYSEPEGLEGFEILKSEKGGDNSGTIPPDTAMCDECLDDLRDPENQYFQYWCTSCVNCGPRFTIIKELPYDRSRTSMDEFPMCQDCEKRYKDPGDRRYHAQTIACPENGPQLFTIPSADNPIPKTAEKLKNGKIVAIKGVGGTHLACDASKTEVVKKLKERAQRPQKPLAVMVKNLEIAEELATISESEKKSLQDIKRPIVVVEEKESSILSKEVSKDLHNVGIMLPYSGLHHLLFNHINFPLVMTSANISGKPMLVKNENIKRELKDIADFMLLHNREIVARCDDSVIRYSGGKRRFIRRSRGWAPTPIELKLGDGNILSLGAEFDNTITLYGNDKCYISQHIGDVENIETLNFLKETIEHLENITNISDFEKIACDLHPDFMTTQLAEEISDNPIRVQHHHAHLASLLGEKGLEEIITIDADGLGYGPDDTIWGGEILAGTKEKYERMGSLSPMLMPGSDLASKFPSRMIGGILHEEPNISEILEKHAHFPGGEKEKGIVEDQIEKKFNTPKTSSAGRFLDAISSLLDICHERRYEGEPAMKLESFALPGTAEDLELDFKKSNDRLVLNVQSLFKKILEMKESGENKRDIAATAQEMLAKGMTKIAIKSARKKNIDTIGFTGGVAYNDSIGTKIKEMVEETDLDYVTNEKVPCGDGGVSFGQTIVASKR